MKTEILVTLLFVAAVSIVGADDDGTGMCPMTYFQKHPDAWDKQKKFVETYGLPDFNKLKSCSSDERCDKGMKCCETVCGMKCMKAVFENNALETIKQTYKETGIGVDNKPYKMTEEDKKYGMCPNNYIKVHPDLREKISQKLSQQKKPLYSRNITTLADCSGDQDCGSNSRCCITMCGKKCMKAVFTFEDLFESIFGKKEENKNREKRDVDSHGKGGKHGKGHSEGAKDRKGHGEGDKHVKGHGEGIKHGKGHDEGAKHGKGHGEGAKHGKGHSEGIKHGKGHRKSKE
ncbi:uncharacterized protein RB166_019161 [Leptodactylus fuscus]